MFIKDFHVCQLAGTQALVFIFAQPKSHANPNFLLFVTLPTLGQETQNLKIQGLTLSKETLNFGWTWDIPIGLPDFFFLRQPRMYLVKWMLNLKQPAAKLQPFQHCCHRATQHGTVPFGTYVQLVGNALNVVLHGKAPISENSCQMCGGKSGE